MTCIPIDLYSTFLHLVIELSKERELDQKLPADFPQSSVEILSSL